VPASRRPAVGHGSVRARGDLTIREAQEADAPAILDYLRELTSEPALQILLSHVQALSFMLASEQEFIRQHAAANGLLLLALSGPRVVGTLDLMGGSRPETAHAVTLGISIATDWRDRGVGRALMTRALAWARATDGISRIELEVFSDNARAIHLYESLGFEFEGRRRRAFIKDGVAIDSMVMALLL
jgi:RimJ/RimL family protein N-acetyltransferase